MIRHTVMVWNITLHFFLANPIATVLIFQSYCFMNTALNAGFLFVLIEVENRIIRDLPTRDDIKPTAPCD